MALTFPRLTPDQQLQGRYRVVSERRPGVYEAVDEGEGLRPLLLVALLSAESEGAARLVDFQHDHLVPLLGIHEEQGDSWLLVTATEGQTLRERLTAKGALSKLKVVRAALRLADALSHLHTEGLWHGRVHPDNVLLRGRIATAPDASASVLLETRALETPCLLFGVAAPTDSPYRMPQRDPDEPGSIADDTWALAALVVEMLTGHPPPREGFTSEDELEALGVEETLRGALFSTLNADPASRSDTLRNLRRALARNYVHHADDEPHHSDNHTTNPPPLPRQPAQDQVALSTNRPITPPPERRRVPLLAVGGLVAGLGLAWGATAMLSEEPAQQPATATVQGAESQPEEQTAIDLNEVAVTGDEPRPTGDRMSACIAAYLPGAHVSQKDGGPSPAQWVCNETDPDRGTAQLSTIASQETRELLTSLGPLAQVAFVVVRQGCCSEPAELASTKAGCEELARSLVAAGQAVVEQGDIATQLDAVTNALSCGGGQAPSAAHREAFLEYVRHIHTE